MIIYFDEKFINQLGSEFKKEFSYLNNLDLDLTINSKWKCGGFSEKNLFNSFNDRFKNKEINYNLSLEEGLFLLKEKIIYPFHYHYEKEFYYILKGEFIILNIINNQIKTYFLKENMWHFHDRNIPHCIISLNNNIENIAIWFREKGDNNQEINYLYGPKWIIKLGDLDWDNAEFKLKINNLIKDNKIEGDIEFSNRVFKKFNSKYRLKVYDPEENI